MEWNSVEKSVGGRNLYVYEVEIEYHLHKRRDEDKTPIYGAYVRSCEATNIENALITIGLRFEAFVQSQDAEIVWATNRKCDLKFRGHVF